MEFLLLAAQRRRFVDDQSPLGLYVTGDSLWIE